MAKKYFIAMFSMFLLPIVSACGGVGHGETMTGYSIIGFGFMGNIISILIIVSLGLSIILLTKKINNKSERRGNGNK